MRALHPTLVKHEMVENYHFRKNHGRLQRVYGGWYEIKLSLKEILYGLPEYNQAPKVPRAAVKQRLKEWCESNGFPVPDCSINDPEGMFKSL